MKQIYFYLTKHFICFALLFILVPSIVRAQCDPLTPTFTLDLSGSPNATSVTPSVVRNGTCCTGTDPCVKIIVILNPNSMALLLEVIGANPGGSLNYEFDCDGQLYPGGTPLCLSGTGTHTLTACKVGGNPNAYSVTAVPKPSVPDSVFVRNGCTQTLVATGFSTSTIQWTAVNSGSNTALFNSYLTCTAGCATVVVSPTTAVPVPYVDYEVSGFGQAPCGTNFYRDTVRVFFYNTLVAPMSPTTICFGSISAVLSPTPTGGKPAYSYSWSTGSTSSSITVGAGNYTLSLSDQTGCPPITSTVTVSQFTLPITANPGPNQVVCKTPAPTVSLNGTVEVASGGVWSGGTGTFSPSNTLLTTSYIPTAGEISTGSVQLSLTSTGNQGCPPGTGTVTITFQDPPLVNAGVDATVCANNAVTTLSGSISGFSASTVWSSSGSGTFGSVINPITTYTPSAGDISTGTVNVILTSTNNGACAASTDMAKITITPKPVVNAGPDQIICSIYSAPLSGTVSGPTNTGTWTSLGDGSFAPSASALNASYTPGTNDISAGTVSLILTSSNNGNCLPEKDTVRITITKPAVPFAGLNQAICSDANGVLLTGTVTGGTTTGIWGTTGGGAFNPTTTALTTSYSITAADIAAGSVIFTLSSTNNGPCPVQSDTVKVTIREIATVTTGINSVLCSSPGTISLSGIITGIAGTGTWTSSGGGTFVPNNSSLNPSYSISATDISNGSVTFTLTSTNNGVCPARSDTVKMKIIQQAIANAGLNQAICSNTNNILLAGSVTGGTNTGVWGTTGSGAFSPNNTALSTSYSITQADITAGSVIFTLSSTNNSPCPVHTDTVKITIREIATVTTGINSVLCSSPGTISLSGIITGVVGTGTWTSSGGGTFVPNNSSLNPSYSISATDISNGFVTFTLTSTNNGVCPARSDTVKMKIIQQAVADAGLNQAICSNTNNILLTGSVTGGTNTGVWGTTGGGAFSPNNTALSTSYSITSADRTAGSVIFTLSSTNNSPCPVYTDTVKITIREIATVTTGINSVLCSSPGTISLSGIITGVAGTGTWTSSGGGTFVPNNSSLNPSYSISATDISNGSVTFTLTSTNNGVCPARSDTVKMKIIQQPTVNAGTNHFLCSGTTSVVLTGSISGSITTVAWTTSGSGGFNPGPTSFTTIYNITPADELAGTLIFTLASTNSGPCFIDQDTSQVSILMVANVNSGNNQTICSSDNFIQLNGAITGASGTGTWSASGTGGFSPNNSNLSPNYSITPSDITNGFVTFTLTSTNNGVCPVKKDSVKINITKLAIVSAGTDLSICSTTQSSVVLSGTVNGGGNAGTWVSSSGGLFSPGPSQLNASYLISSTDISNGNVFLTLQSVNSNPCPEVKDTIKINISTKAVVNAGPNQVICSHNNPLSLTGNVSGGGSSGIWTSLTSGTFSPSNTNLNASYSLTPADIANGAAVFTLSSTNNGACPVMTDSVKIVIKKIASVNAGADKSICSTQLSVPLGGVITGATTSGTWITTGAGSFMPNAGALNGSYVAGTADVNSGTVLLILTSTNNDVCPAVSDTLKISIVKNPQISLKLDTTICEKQNPFKVTAQFSGGSGVFQWATSGTGTFSPSLVSLPAYYHFTPSDVSAGGVVVSLNSINNGACGNKSASMNIQILPSAKALFTASSYTVSLPAEPVVFTNQSTNANSYKWNFGDGASSTLGNPSHQYTSVGYYTVTLIANNTYGCRDTSDQVLTVISDVQFPTAFTPNPAGPNGGGYTIKDLSNDVFFPYTAGVTEYDLMIFNRWGELIFRTSDINTGWDGYFNGKLCQQDAYVWKANVKFFDGRTYNKTGSVTLLR